MRKDMTIKPKYKQGDVQEDDVIKIRYIIRREGTDPLVKDVIGQVIQDAGEEYFILGDIGQDVGPSLLIYYDNVLDIEHFTYSPDQVQEAIGDSWHMMNRLPVSGQEMVDQIIKLTQFLQVLTAGPVADQ
jgi:hypothetical protein